MSKANSPIKVLKTAIKRLNKGWTTCEWSKFDPETGQVYVCLEGAIFGFCMYPSTQAQKEALDACNQIVLERHPSLPESAAGRAFNDSLAETADEMVEICKLAIIRLETGGPIEFDPDGEELADLLPKKS